MKQSDSIAKLAPALVKAVSSMEGVTKDAENDGFKRNGVGAKYATLAACVDASREALASNGLCVIQGPGASNTEAKTLCITTRIIHESGEWIETDFDMPLTKWSPHEAGSATTYGRRFALMAMLGLAPVEDDDGNSASGVNPKQAKPASSVHSDGKDWWGCDGPGMTAAKAKEAGLGEKMDGWISEIRSLSSAKEWRDWCGAHTEEVKLLPQGWRTHLRDEAEVMAKELGVDMNAKG